MIHTWGLRLVLEVGAIKDWGQTGATAFEKGSKYWDRFISLGGKVDGITMDEPLDYTRKKSKGPVSFALEQTAQFIALVRHKYPTMTIEETETYPSIAVQDHIAWIDALQARLKQMGVRGIDSYRLDVNWLAFNLNTTPKYKGKLQGNWWGVTQIESACRARHIPFNLIYWAADEPQLKRIGLANDSSWYVGIMSEAGAYAVVGGKPDIYCIESWIHMPLSAIPETDQWTFTRSVLDFCTQFVPGRK